MPTKVVICVNQSLEFSPIQKIKFLNEGTVFSYLVMKFVIHILNSETYLCLYVSRLIWSVLKFIMLYKN